MGALSASLGGCASSPSFLLPAGPIAGEDRHLLVIVLLLLLIVVVPVFVGLPWVLWRYRRGNAKASYQPRWDFSKPLEFAIWGVPALIVVILGWQLWVTTHRLDPYKRLPGNGDALEVQAIALDWKWLFIYPQQNVATVNRLVIPVGRPVHIDLTSDTVMQSLMIPQLAGQIYAMAGMRTQLNLRADRPGAYFGENTQYNGDGFHEQNFVTDAVPAAAFQAWAKKAAQGNLTLDDARYDILSRQSTLPRPLAFSSVSPGLFQQIVDKYHGHAPQAAPRREASRQ
ncbi:MAG TPA: COX aromatic rich motif-containing protein [Sphingomonas sp.]